MQQQKYGTAWMAQPPIRQNEDAAYSQTIGRMNLKEVRSFLCAKSRGDPLACVSCAGFKGCQAGQRAVVLLDEETKMVQELVEPAYSNNPASRDMAEFRKACESGNAWNYLMTVKGMSKGSAREKLVYWIGHYKSIAQEYGGKDRIMAKPKQVSTVNAPELARVEPVPASDTQDEQVEGPADETPYEPGKNPGTISNLRACAKARTEKAREYCKMAVASGNPYQYLKDEDETRTSAYIVNTISRWRIRYPDLMAGVPYMNELPGMKTEESKPESAQKEQETEVTALEDTGNDEVSLLDFLTEYGSGAEEPEEPQQEALQEAPEGPREDDTMRDKLNAKYDELNAEKAALAAQIREAEERIRWIEEQQDALAKCLNMFFSRTQESTGTGRS